MNIIKMWHLSKIPKIAHFYFGGKTLPYLRYLSIASFAKHNPDWSIFFYYPNLLSEDKTWETEEHKTPIYVTDYFYQLSSLPIKIIQINFSKLNIDNNISEIHKSDFLRLYLLNKYGGLWSDTDIIYNKPMNQISINCDENKNIDTCFCIDDGNVSFCCHYIGFIMSSYMNQAFNKLYNLSQSYFCSNKYQCIGTNLYSKIFPDISAVKKQFPNLNIINIPVDCVYPYHPKDISKIYELNNTNVNLSGIGLHWFGGHPLACEFLQKTDGGKNNLPNNIIARLINEI